MAGKTDIWVYADWDPMPEPVCIGILGAQQAKGKKAFSFSYNDSWIQSEERFLLDPDIQWFKGPQYPGTKENFGAFLDSMPDTWGRTLMKRRAAIVARSEGKAAPALYDIDFLLGVYDEGRMGGLRFKTDPAGPFLDNSEAYPTPPWPTIRELQHGAQVLEENENDEEVRKWLSILMAPGSSLGGARPKANVLDDKKHPWIAKFPSKGDTIDKGGWEYLAHTLGMSAGLNMAQAKIQKISGRYHTYFTRRFDRANGARIHFASAMTMTGNNEDTIRDSPASYLDLVEFIQGHGADVEANLEELWSRMVFNIMISNTDDHLRNHGFLLTPKGWILSPAYDVNPSIDKDHLSLTIDGESAELDIAIARQTGAFFRLSNQKMTSIIERLSTTVQQWRKLADQIGISRTEQELMQAAFREY